MNIRHKFNAVQTELNGISFPSKAEARYYAQLQLRQKAGDLVFFLRQVPFDLPGKTRYWLDFMIFEKDGTVRCIDVKSKATATQTYKMKKRQVEMIYPVKIEEAE